MTSELQGLASRALTKQDPNAPWWTKLVAGLLLLLGLWLLQRKLDLQARDLAEARGQIEKERLQGHRERALAKAAELKSERLIHEEKAREAFAAARKKVAQVEAAEAVHQANLAALQTIQDGDWGALSELAAGGK